MGSGKVTFGLVTELVFFHAAVNCFDDSDLPPGFVIEFQKKDELWPTDRNYDQRPPFDASRLKPPGPASLPRVIQFGIFAQQRCELIRFLECIQGSLRPQRRQTVMDVHVSLHSITGIRQRIRSRHSPSRLDWEPNPRVPHRSCMTPWRDKDLSPALASSARPPSQRAWEL